MKRMILFLAAALAGCGAPVDRLTDEEAAAGQNAMIEETVAIDVPPATSPAPPASPVLRYTAIGTEPGWALNVTPKTMRYEGEYGSVVIAEPTPPRFRPVPGRYAATRLQLTIAPGPCNDGMSDRTYRDTVSLVADGKTVSGCGGEILPKTAAPDAPSIEPTINAI